MFMLIHFKTPNLVMEISRKTGLVSSSNFFHEVKSDPNAIVVAFYFANTDDEEIVVVRFGAVLNGTNVVFKDARSVVVTTPSDSWFNQETRIAIRDDREENHPVIAKMVAKLLRSK